MPCRIGGAGAALLRDRQLLLRELAVPLLERAKRGVGARGRLRAGGPERLGVRDCGRGRCGARFALDGQRLLDPFEPQRGGVGLLLEHARLLGIALRQRLCCARLRRHREARVRLGVGGPTFPFRRERALGAVAPGRRRLGGLRAHAIALREHDAVRVLGGLEPLGRGALGGRDALGRCLLERPQLLRTR